MLARAVLAVTSREYVFVDEWDVAAPQEAVFAALSDMASYPVWWRRVHLSAQADGPVAIGSVARQHFTGRLPYTLRTTTRVVELERPRLLAVDVDGHLRGHGRWTLTPTGGGTRVRFDWQVDAERLLLRVLTPLLRPALRRNHAWAIARAREGLEPYALELAQAAAGAPAREAQATR
jgi:carbon monoxide dehydrogenase subunit G